MAFLHETLTPAVGCGTLLVVIGAIWLYYRGHWSWWGLGAAILGAGSSVCSKEVIAWGSYSAHSGLAFGIGALLMTPLAYKSTPAGWQTLGRNLWTNRYLVLLSSTATLLYYWALPLAPLNQVSPLVRINLVIGFFLSYFHLGETKSWKSRAFGVVLLLAGIILVLWRD
jgi:drug/metabolite transporter (DMT)-like permease